MIRIRRARPADATAIAEVHVDCWRNTYAGILPGTYLSGLSIMRIAAGYQRGMIERRNGEALFVAVAPDGPAQTGSRIVGFASGARCRQRWSGLDAEGEIQTLYVQEDWRDLGIGRRLMRATAAHLAAIGCSSAMLWVLSDNPSRWFYQRLEGRTVASGKVRVDDKGVPQTAFCWDPIEKLLRATASANGH
ncbi:GNAT family N-acetyltransferase [Pseudoroseomonas globiformis]|uniref:GNAT family N-acetyltransferase n=1 Tax=Teichococcus globiformis TaxID=2307229 RepID=A0ABV7FZP1_9PROT